MSELILLNERIITSIGLGESHFREFKSALEGPPTEKKPRDKKEIAKDICSTLVAFANADGGELFVGVEDIGTITGVPHQEDTLEYLRNCWKDGVHQKTPLSNVKAISLRIENQTILYFSTQRSSAYVHQTSDGKCLQRRDLETIPIAVEEIQFTRQERISQEYDRQFVDGALADALDIATVKSLADNISVGMSVEKCLQYLDLADFANGYLRLRRAALLLFSREPAKWHPRLQIRILRVNGLEMKTGPDYNISSDRYVQGNILKILDEAWDALRPELVQTRLTGAAKFESKVMYPEFACREALINAVAHRDYSIEGRGIEVYIFDDRMEVKSPGGLLSSLSIHELKRLSGAHQSRNALVARVLREIGYMREVGEGMRRIFELMKSNELSEPDIESTSDTFSVSLRNKPLYRPEHLLWLENFSELDLSREQKTIIVLGYSGKHISANDIWNALGLVDTEHYRRLIASLQSLNILVTLISREAAKKQARASRINNRDVPRFAIQIPQVSSSIKGKTRAPIPRKRVNIAVETEDGLDDTSRVFLSNLPYKFDREALLSHIRGLNIDGDLVFPRTGRSYAFVQLTDESSRDAALNSLDNSQFEGRRLVARKAILRSSRRTLPS
jgi:ATP-dependent DNA helicase RecG